MKQSESKKLPQLVKSHKGFRIRKWGKNSYSIWGKKVLKQQDISSLEKALSIIDGYTETPTGREKVPKFITREQHDQLGRKDELKRKRREAEERVKALERKRSLGISRVRSTFQGATKADKLIEREGKPVKVKRKIITQSRRRRSKK